MTCVILGVLGAGIDFIFNWGVSGPLCKWGIVTGVIFGGVWARKASFFSWGALVHCGE